MFLAEDNRAKNNAHNNRANWRKTMRKSSIIVGLICLTALLGSTTWADERTDEKRYDGTVTAVNKDAGTITVKKALISHTFKLATPATISIKGKAIATLGDLREGDDVEVFYHEEGDNKIAHRIVHKNMEKGDDDRGDAKRYDGKVTAVNKDARTITVKKGLISHTFTLATPATISIKGKTVATLGDLREGDEVEVFYHEEGDNKVAVRIVHKNMEKGEAGEQGDLKRYDGKVTAINKDARTVTVKKALISHTFTLDTPTTISIKGKAIATLGDLREGDEVEVFYREEGDNKIATRIVHKNMERGEAEPRRDLKEFDGRIAAVDKNARTVTVKKMLKKETFALATPTTIRIKDKGNPTLGDLREGDSVHVYYTEENGRKVAREIVHDNAMMAERRHEKPTVTVGSERREDKRFEGTVTALDRNARTMKLKRGTTSQTFRIEPAASIITKDKNPAMLDDLKLGEQVEVYYRDEGDNKVAYHVTEKDIRAKAE
jgi:Cu/Ag efflux protein CusF